MKVKTTNTIWPEPISFIISGHGNSYWQIEVCFKLSHQFVRSSCVLRHLSVFFFSWPLSHLSGMLVLVEIRSYNLWSLLCLELFIYHLYCSPMLPFISFIIIFVHIMMLLHKSRLFEGVTVSTPTSAHIQLDSAFFLSKCFFIVNEKIFFWHRTVLYIYLFIFKMLDDSNWHLCGSSSKQCSSRDRPTLWGSGVVSPDRNKKSPKTQMGPWPCPIYD